MPGRSSNSANPNDNYKFTGHELDQEANLTMYHMNARGYDPITGRFNSIDPLADQFPNISTYAYGNNNPLRFTDPTGMAPEEAGDCPTCRQVLGHAFSWLERPWNDAGQQVEQKSQEIKQEVAQATETVVKEGTEVLDVVTDASIKAATVTGSGMVAAAITPVPVDDLGLGAATVTYGTVAAVSDATATALTFVDAYVYDGSKSEAWGRGARTLSSFFGTAALGSYLGRVATKHLSAEQINAASKVTIGVGTAIINE